MCTHTYSSKSYSSLTNVLQQFVLQLIYLWSPTTSRPHYALHPTVCPDHCQLKIKNHAMIRGEVTHINSYWKNYFEAAPHIVSAWVYFIIYVQNTDDFTDDAEFQDFVSFSRRMNLTDNAILQNGLIYIIPPIYWISTFCNQKNVIMSFIKVWKL